ncbi:MAG TPA: hypothetical protein VFZ01_01280 [Geminicoccaceae bacterium]
MPIVERDPWRMQYFEHAACPEEIRIPTEDGDAYQWFPEHRWIYNKLAICETQGLVCGLHGMEPPSFPVFSKPVYNMRGMGAGSRVFRSRKEYGLNQRAGHMWMPMFEGEHVSSDVAVVGGEPVWWRHTIGTALQGGMFDYWTVLAEARPEIEDYVGGWVRRNFQTYTGVINVETIGARIIEAHLRFSDQWPDLYGEGWIQALVGLYRDGLWEFADGDRRDGFSVVLFGSHGLQYYHPSPELIDELLKHPLISSIQITFHEDKPPSAHSMPPGGFRLAIVNGWDMAACRDARERLALRFWSGQQIVPRRPRRQARSG